MQEFTGLQYLKIDIANTFGLDKLTWDKRLAWVNEHESELHSFRDTANKPLMYYKAVRAYEAALRGEAIGHVMYLDACASGIQIMAALTGCKSSAMVTNMIDPTVRNDAYEIIVNDMNAELPVSEQVDREFIKRPVTSHNYNKADQETFSNIQKKVFYAVMNGLFPGVEATKTLCNSMWNSEALYHEVTFPDGHVARMLVTQVVNSTIEIDELDHVQFSYRHRINLSDTNYVSLCPNLVQGIEAYIARQMIRKCKEKDIEVYPIFDAFGSHPNHMNDIRRFYKDILADIAKSNLLQDLLSQLGLRRKLDKFSYDLHLDIAKSEYMLS